MRKKIIGVVVILLGLVYNQALQQVMGPRIVEHPKNTYVVRDDLPVLNCSVESNPPAVITWYKDGHLVTTSAEDNSSNRMVLPGGRLFFLKFVPSGKGSLRSDVGLYYCNATNPDTKVSAISRPARLDVAVIRDEFREHPQSIDATPGQDILLNCRPPRGDPEPKVKWVKDNNDVTPSDRILIEDNNLKILQARQDDVGSYTCVAFNLAGERESHPAQLVLRERPVIIRGPDDAVVDEGTDIMLLCQATGDPEPTVVWRKLDGEVPSFRSSVLDDNSLTIQNVRVSDAGVYVCRVENSFGWQEAEARLTVYYKPRFSVVPKNKIALKNRIITLSCLIIGNPTPVVYWTRLTDNVPIYPNQVVERMYLTEEGTLYVAPTVAEDTGEYVCSGISQSGNVSTKVRLEIKDVSPGHPPIIGLGPQSQILPEGSWAVLHCEASGSNTIGISWLKDNSVLSLHNSRLTIIEGGSLQISALSYEDTGMYTCKAVSEAGETTWSSHLQVEPKSSHVVFYRTPGKGNFPGPPTELTVTEVSETGVRLSWQRNSSVGTSYPHSFVIEYFNLEDGEGWEVASDKVEDTTELVQNLKPATTYLFFVRARNSHGLSYPSPVSRPVKTKGEHVGPTLPTLSLTSTSVSEKMAGERISGPPIVHLLGAEVLSSTLVKVTWELRKNQKYIEGFRIAYHKVEAENFDDSSSSASFSLPPPVFEEVVSNPAATMYVLSNMEKFTSYDVTVRPYFRSIRGTESNVVRIRTQEDVPTSPPVKIEAYYLDNNTLQVLWEMPSHDQLHGVLLGYKIYILGDEGHKGKELPANASTTSIVIKPVPREHLKKVQMSAVTGAGEGVRSQPIYIGKHLDQPSSELLGKKGSDNTGGQLMLEPWFIGVVVSVVGAVLWVSLCIFTLYVYRRKRGSKKDVQGQQMTCKVSTAISNKTHQMPLLGSTTAGNGNCYLDTGCYDAKAPADQENQLFGHTYQTLESLQDQHPSHHDTTFADSGFCSSGLLLPQQPPDNHIQQQVVRSNQVAPGQSSSMISTGGGGKQPSSGLPNIPNPAAYMIRHGSNSTTMSSGKSQGNKPHPSFPGTGTGISNNSRAQDLNCNDGLANHQYIQQQQQQQQQHFNAQQQLFKASLEQLPPSSLPNFYSHLQLKKLPVDPLSDVNAGTYHSGGPGVANLYQENVWYPDLPPGNSQIENLLQYGVLSDSTSPQSCVDCKNSTSYDSPCVGNLDSSYESRPSLAQDSNRRTGHQLPDLKSTKFDHLYQTGPFPMNDHHPASSSYCNDVGLPLMSKSHLGKTREWTTLDYMDHNNEMSEMYPLEKVTRSSVPQSSRAMTESVFNPNGDVYNQKNKKSKSARQRAHRSASPCSTDSSYGGTGHVLKPKSQRKKQQSVNKLDHDEFSSAFKPIRADDIIIGKAGHYGSLVGNNDDDVVGKGDASEVFPKRKHNSTFDVSDDSEETRRSNVMTAFEMANMPVV